MTEDRYFRGIADAQVEDHEGIPATDHPAVAGMPREEAIFNGTCGTLETTTSYEPRHGSIGAQGVRQVAGTGAVRSHVREVADRGRPRQPSKGGARGRVGSRQEQSSTQLRKLDIRRCDRNEEYPASDSRGAYKAAGRRTVDDRAVAAAGVGAQADEGLRWVGMHLRGQALGTAERTHSRPPRRVDGSRLFS